jgi:hypothetical protein
MQKALATLAMLSVCAAATSVAYYYMNYLPRLHDAELAERRRRTDLENAQRCSTDSSRFYTDHQRPTAPESLGRRRDWLDPETHFSKKLNTCLAEIGFNDRSRIAGVTGFRAVVDIYSNREIISYTYRLVDGEERAIPLIPNAGGIRGSREYEAEKDKLFSE